MILVYVYNVLTMFIYTILQEFIAKNVPYSRNVLDVTIRFVQYMFMAMCYFPYVDDVEGFIVNHVKIDTVTSMKVILDVMNVLIVTMRMDILGNEQYTYNKIVIFFYLINQILLQLK